MIKQKNHQKCTALGKRRVNLFKLEQAVKRQFGINQRLHSALKLQSMLIEDLTERVKELECEQSQQDVWASLLRLCRGGLCNGKKN